MPQGKFCIFLIVIEISFFNSFVPGISPTVGEPCSQCPMDAPHCVTGLCCKWQLQHTMVYPFKACTPTMLNSILNCLEPSQFNTMGSHNILYTLPFV